MMYLCNFCKIFTFTMCSNQLIHQSSTHQPKTNKQAATSGQNKLTIDYVYQFFNANTGKELKILLIFFCFSASNIILW